MDVKYLKLNQFENYLSEHPDRDRYYIFNYETEYFIADYNYCVDKATGDIYIGTPVDSDGPGSIILYDEYF